MTEQNIFLHITKASLTHDLILKKMKRDDSQESSEVIETMGS